MRKVTKKVNPTWWEHAAQAKLWGSKNLRDIFGYSVDDRSFGPFIQRTFGDLFAKWLKVADQVIYLSLSRTVFGLADLFSASHEVVYGSPLIKTVESIAELEEMLGSGNPVACQLLLAPPRYRLGSLTCLLSGSCWGVRFSTREPDLIEQLVDIYQSLPKSSLKSKDDRLFPDSGRWLSHWECSTDWMFTVWERVNTNHKQLQGKMMKLITEDITLDQLGEVNLPFLTTHLFRLVDESLTQHDDPSRVKRDFKTPVGEFHLTPDDNEMQIIINRAFSVLDDEIVIPEDNPHGRTVPYQIIFDLYRLDPAKSTARHTLVFKKPDEAAKKASIKQVPVDTTIRVRAKELTDSMDVFFVEGNMLFDMDMAKERDKLLDAIERDKPTIVKYLITEFTNTAVSLLTIADQTLRFQLKGKSYGFTVKEPAFAFEHSEGRLPDSAIIKSFTLTIGRAVGQITLVEAIIDYVEGTEHKHGSVTVTWNRTDESQIAPLLVRHEEGKQIPWQEFEMKELS